MSMKINLAEGKLEISEDGAISFECSAAMTAAAAVRVMFQDLIPKSISDFSSWPCKPKLLTPRRAALAVQEQVNGRDRFRGHLHDGPCSLDEAILAVKNVMPELWAEHFIGAELKTELSIV